MLGTVRVQLGGAAGPVLDLAAGDVVALPAGIGHRRIGASADLLVVGAYPPGEPPRESRAAADPTAHDAALVDVARTPDPPGNPVTGAPWPVQVLGVGSARPR